MMVDRLRWFRLAAISSARLSAMAAKRAEELKEGLEESLRRHRLLRIFIFLCAEEADDGAV